MNSESEHPYTEIVWEFAQKEGRLPSKPRLITDAGILERISGNNRKRYSLVKPNPISLVQ